jgi:hypothetical protein
VKECHQKEDIHAVRHASQNDVLSANAKPFFEAFLNILEKLRELARKSKAVGGLNARRSNGRRPGTKPASTSEGVHASIASE